MDFEYRGFLIQCATAVGGAGLIGTVTIWQTLADDERIKVFASESPTSFPTQREAIDHARAWGEMLCNQWLIPDWGRTVQSPRPRNQKRSHTSLKY
jgi:hypothetical protein